MLTAMGDGACKIAADEGDDMVGNIAGDNCTDAVYVCSAVVWECSVHIFILLLWSFMALYFWFTYLS